MRRATSPFLAIAMTAAVAFGGMITVSEAASRAGQQCGNFLECLFGGINNGNSSRSGGASSFGSGGGNYGPSTRTLVSFSENHKPGTIIVDTSERNLYLVQGGGKAYKYRVGVGRDGFQWSGTSRSGRKAEWPTWTPPAAMIEREKKKGVILPAQMKGGPNNPLGARALYISGTLYRLHGTNNPSSIGGAVSSGCIRLTNTDIIDLYNRAKVGAKVIVRR
jgi:lipoprotein-anchoring transpeptidase ErfK/SrfK